MVSYLCDLCPSREAQDVIILAVSHHRHQVLNLRDFTVTILHFSLLALANCKVSSKVCCRYCTVADLTAQRISTRLSPWLAICGASRLYHFPTLSLFLNRVRSMSNLFLLNTSTIEGPIAGYYESAYDLGSILPHNYVLSDLLVSFHFSYHDIINSTCCWHHQ